MIFMMRWICTASTGGDATAPAKIGNLTLDMWNVRWIEHPLRETSGGLSIKRNVEVHSQKWRSQRTSIRNPRRKLRQQNFQIPSHLRKVFKIIFLPVFQTVFVQTVPWTSTDQPLHELCLRYYCYIAKNGAHFICAFLGSFSTKLFAKGLVYCTIFKQQICFYEVCKIVSLWLVY